MLLFFVETKVAQMNWIDLAESAFGLAGILRRRWAASNKKAVSTSVETAYFLFE